jgi:GNAT superfamily N-acetyltransferase
LRRALRPDWVLLAAFRDGVLLGYAAAQDDGSYLRSGGSHHTAKLHDLYTASVARGQRAGRTLMRGIEAWAQARGARYLFCSANLREATPAYERREYMPGAEVREGYRFFEVDFSERTARQPHPERGS